MNPSTLHAALLPLSRAFNEVHNGLKVRNETVIDSDNEAVIMVELVDREEVDQWLQHAKLAAFNAMVYLNLATTLIESKEKAK